jgi:hypothetical protein
VREAAGAVRHRAGLVHDGVGPMGHPREVGRSAREAIGGLGRHLVVVVVGGRILAVVVVDRCVLVVVVVGRRMVVGRREAMVVVIGPRVVVPTLGGVPVGLDAHPVLVRSTRERLAGPVVVVAEVAVPRDVEAGAELDAEQPHEDGHHCDHRAPQ